MKHVRKIIVFLAFFASLNVSVNTKATENPEFDISVEAIFPSNQLTTEVEYFDLRVKPSDEQKIQIKLTNHTSKKKELKIAYSDAKTTSQGVIEYSKNNDLRIESPKEYLFTNVLSGPDQIILDPKEMKEVTFVIKMPDQIFDGFILGGIEFLQKIEQENSKNVLRAQKSHLIGFKLSETDKKVPVDLTLNQTIVGTKNYKSAILLTLVNQNGNLVENLTINAEVSKKEDPTVLLETNMSQVRLAPYSILEIPLYLDNTLLDSGDYDLQISVNNKNDFYKKWSQEFKITKKDVELSKKNLDMWEGAPKKSKLWYVLALGILLIFLIGVMLIIWLNRENLLKNKKVKGKEYVEK